MIINMKKSVRGAAMMAAAFVSLLATRYAFAQTSSGSTTGSNASSVTLVNPLGTTDFSTVLNNFINFLSTDIILPLAVIMVLVGAIQFMTSSGNPEKVSRANKTLLYAAIGVVVALLASEVTSIIKSILLGQ